MWNSPATPQAKRPRAMWAIGEPIIKYTMRERVEKPPEPEPEPEYVRPVKRPAPSSSKRQQAPSPPAKRVRATKADGSPLLPEGWVEEVRVPASGREYRIYLGPQPGMVADSRVKAWETHERAKAGLPIKGTTTGQEYTEQNGKRKRGAAGRARVCLACDLGRKRRCTCGKRTRRW
jgi:hypothetical protein